MTVGAMDEYRRIFGEGDRRRRSQTVRVVAAVDGVMTELDVDIRQWNQDRAELSHQVRLLQDGDLARLVDLIGTDPVALQVHPRNVARAIIRELHERTGEMLAATEGWDLEDQD